MNNIGSPPRMRGKLFVVGLYISKPRITPAHAGKTLRAVSGEPRRADHPRACGENLISSSEHSPTGGSPPRMRGKLLGVAFRPHVLRITPAHAGKTLSLSFRLLSFADHPRACGENERFV